jgi:hypothetical protein
MARGKSADQQARENVDDAIDVLREIMISPLAEDKDRLRAAESMLDRGYGKAAQAIIAIPAGKRQAEQLAQYDDEQLLDIIRETPLPRLSAPEPEVEPIIEAEFDVVEPDIDPLLL